VQLFKVQPCGCVRRFDRRRRWRRRARSLFHQFRGRFSIGTKMRPDFISKIIIECTGVRLLIRNTQSRQVVNYHIAFYFQFTRQFVNPDLSHSWFAFSLTRAHTLGLGFCRPVRKKPWQPYFIFLHLLFPPDQVRLVLGSHRPLKARFCRLPRRACALRAFPARQIPQQQWVPQ